MRFILVFLGTAMSFGTNDPLRSTGISFWPFVIYRNLKKYLLLEVAQCFCVFCVCVCSPINLKVFT